jgi:hypothetical protein
LKVFQYGKNTRGDGCSLAIPQEEGDFQGSTLFNGLPKDLKVEK